MLKQYTLVSWSTVKQKVLFYFLQGRPDSSSYRCLSRDAQCSKWRKSATSLCISKVKISFQLFDLQRLAALFRHLERWAFRDKYLMGGAIWMARIFGRVV
jgi:hypothetical protein